MINLVNPSVEILTPLEEIADFPRRIEVAGRTCYQSERKIKEGSADHFCTMLIGRGHESVLEHCSITARFVCDRSTSHQIVRHRLCAFSQESQRYVAYKDAVDVIFPLGEAWRISRESDNKAILGGFVDQSTGAFRLWYEAVDDAAETYRVFLNEKMAPEDARSLLPNCTATQIVMSANVRQWRHVFRERAFNSHAQAQVRLLMAGLWSMLTSVAPCLFDDLCEDDWQ